MNQKNIVARFITPNVPGTILAIFLRQGKNGFNTSVRLRQEGQKTQTGARTQFTHEEEEKAVAEWERLKADALAKGWAVKGGGTRESKAPFTEIPAAASMVVPAVATEPVAEVPAVATPAKAGKTTKK